ncbi:MAG: MFS transporter [Dehalococcoidales bacterium]|nr:MFS transporter [Dehalococcoidales bacterium]
MEQAVKAAPARGYRWVILGVLWLTFVIIYSQRLSLGPLAPFLKAELNMTSTQIGLVMSAIAVGFMTSQFPVGWLVDRIGARWPMAIGELIAGSAMIVLFFIPSYASLLGLMFVAGLGCGFLMPATTQGVIVWFPPKERATVMGLKQTSTNVGGIFSAAFLPTIALALGWRYGFLVLGVIAIATGLVVLALYREPVKINETASAGHSKGASALDVLKNRQIWLVALAGTCLAWVEFTVMAHLTLYLTEALFLPIVAAGGILAMVQFAGAMARPGAGLLSDRAFNGRRKPVFMLMAGVTCAICLTIGLLGPTLSWGIYPVLFLLGFGGTSFGGVFLTLISELAGRQAVGKAVGMSSTIANLGFFFGPVIFGSLVDRSGSYQIAWLSLALMAGLCLCLLLFVREKKEI